MAEITDLFRRALASFDVRVHAIRDDQWRLPTPDAEWDVRALLNHGVYEVSWAPETLGGRTIAEVGDRFEGDLLGDDPKGAWSAARDHVLAAIDDPGIELVTVELSRGAAPAGEYLTELACDLTIHAWDLARAISAPEALDPELVDFALNYFAENADMWRTAGVLGVELPVTDDVDNQSRLLALTGREA